MKLNSHAFAFLILQAICVSAQTPLPKNGGINDDRPTYDNPEDAVYKAIEPKLKTRWTDDVAANPENAWQEYPRPLLRRDTWLNLNGVWEFQFANGADDVNDVPVNKTLNQRVLVPFCIESGLSGIAQQSTFNWYRREFDLPSTFTENVILHFAAVDYQATVFVNGQQVGNHTGGYDKFAFDITSHVAKNTTNEVILFIYDPTDSLDGNIPIGKQRKVPSHIFYTPCTGIWQTVSLEAVPRAEYITEISLRASADGTVNTTITTSANSSSPVSIAVLDPCDNSKTIFTANGTANVPFSFTVSPAPKTWTPDAPNLYNMTVTVGDDTAQTYTGFRTVERKEIDGVQRFVLNGKPMFQFGPLDQGYWPDGLHSAPSYEAMVSDLHYLKSLGMNFLRKHIKVEPDLFYYAADTMGLIIMQDMPALDLRAPTPDQQTEFERQLDIMVRSHMSFPSILTFMIYNEGWGQLDTAPEIEITPHLASILSGHQLINSVSGWNDWAQQKFNLSVGDYHDNHHYSSPQCGAPFYSIASTPNDPRRIGFQGEFGGVGVNTTIEHLWNDRDSIAGVNQTYEIDDNIEIWNYRALRVIEELREQTEMFNCNGGVYTQTTDVEGEVNGFLTYDREENHVDTEKWKTEIQALYDTFNKKVSGYQTKMSRQDLMM
ncbi:glycoside hydrolase family 2 protein [Mycena rosella]|uniref:Glycoside hydrolase family 2 protein n=1 Tax=Mycena rosella TaxID=1033263 RepID=A0AAD7G1J4_MYCRO|nr:glycoside hydrolase family 2 protein [Mycena rosella]